MFRDTRRVETEENKVCLSVKNLLTSSRNKCIFSRAIDASDDLDNDMEKVFHGKNFLRRAKPSGTREEHRAKR
jgi:hypothetical protein